MKKSFIFALILINLVMADFILAGSLKNLDEKSYSQYESNLLAGLQSNNLGLQLSSAYYLGEIRSEKAVIPLVKLLRGAEAEDLRIISALSLIKIEDEHGVYMVKQAQKFNDNDKTRSKCKLFYTAFLVKKYENKQPERNLFLAGVVK